MKTQLQSFALALYQLAGGFWLGLMVFFTFGVARTLFGALPREEAGAITTLLFPTYYTFGYCSAVVCLVALAASGRAARWASAGFVLLTVAVICMAINHFGLSGPVEQLRMDGDREGFRRLHAVAMILNLSAMVLVGVAMLFGRRAHPSPAHEPSRTIQTSPQVEPPPSSPVEKP